MRRRHVFGNTPLDSVMGNIPRMPLEHVYVEPNGMHVPMKGQEVDKQELPALGLVKNLLETRRIIAIDQGFGSGKSLTARTLVWQLSHKWLESDEKDKEWFPVLIRCAGSHFDQKEETALGKFLTVGLDNLKALLGEESCEFRVSQSNQYHKIVWVLDGLDELTTSPQELRHFYNSLQSWCGVTWGKEHRFVLTARTTVAQEVLERQMPQTWFRKHVARVALLHFDKTHRERWLARWNDNLTADHNEDTEFKIISHAEHLIDDELYKVPLLLFMGAIAGSGDTATPSKAVLYERFCAWVAIGKWHEPPDFQTPAGAGLCELGRQTRDSPHNSLVALNVGTPHLDEDARRGASHLLYILSRLAWESVVIEQEHSPRWRMLGATRRDEDQDTVSGEVIGRVLEELEYSIEDSSNILSSVLLNAMGTGTSGGTAFLFGHKSFREYLAMRYHLAVFLFLAEGGVETTSSAAAAFVEIIGRGDLMDYSEETRDFQRCFSELPQLDERRLGKLAAWCMNEAENERLVAPIGEPLTLLSERRASLRFAALGFCAALGVIHQFPLPDKPEDEAPPYVTGLLTFHELRLRDARRSGEALVLTGADLRNIGHGPSLSAYGADLKEANFYDTHLMHSCFNGASLDNADFRGSLLRAVGMHNAVLNGAKFGRSSLRGADFSEAKLRNADLRGSDMERLNFFEANLEKANFYGRPLKFVDFRGAKATGAIFEKASFHFCCFIDADLRNANMQHTMFRYSQLGSAILWGADLRGADLEGVELESARFQGARYNSETKWPAEFDPIEAGAIFMEEGT